MKPSWRRVLRLLARGMCLYEINAPNDLAGLDWYTPESWEIKQHPDRVHVSKDCFAYLRQHALVLPAKTVRIGDQVDRTWLITEAGRAAL